MILAISRLSSFGYRRIAKPLLFRQSPDSVHERLLQLGKHVQRVAVLRGLIRLMWQYDNASYLSQTINDIRFPNPVGLSAGFDKNFVVPPLLKAVGFGFMEGGSLTFKACPGNPKPWFHRLPKSQSLVVHVGLANEGVRTIVERITHYPKGTFHNFPLNISVARTNLPITRSDNDAVDDYLGSLEMLQKNSVGDMYTLNISCPNTYGGEPFNVPDKLELLLSAVDKLEIKQPVFIKMPGDLAWEKFDALLKVANTHTISGVIIQNLAKDRSKLELRDPLPDSIKGNLSGKPTWETSNELIRQTRRAYGDRFTIIGVGGIFSAEDAYTKIRLGANVVELITGMIFEGPALIGQINHGLVTRLKRDGFTNISQAVGVDA